MLPSSNAAMVRSALCLVWMSPLIAAAATLALSRSATSSVACLVRTNAARRLLHLEHAHHIHLAVARHEDVALRNVVGGGCFQLGSDLDRVVQETGGDLGIAGGMVAENNATCLYSGVSDRMHWTTGEAHLQHLVGLVEHQVVQARQIQPALLEVIDHPARRADHHLGATLEPR